MPNSFTRLYVHIVFTPRKRYVIPHQAQRDKILRYMEGIIINLKSHLITGHLMPDHVHLLVSLHPSLSVAEFVQKVKANSSKFVNTEKMLPGIFSWNEGYGGFTVSHSKLDTVKNYIQRQEEHHKSASFQTEMQEFLKAHSIEADFEAATWMTSAE